MIHADPIAVDSPLDRKLTITVFADETAKTKREYQKSLRELAPYIDKRSAPSRDKLPWLKLASFGEKRSAVSLRNNANVISISGIEVDYDGERISVAQAADMFRTHRVAAMIYTSPSHSAAAPRWRALLPASASLQPAKRERLCGIVNRVLGGAVDGASFTLSQSYYYGRVGENPDHEIVLIDGRYIDYVDELEPLEKVRSAGRKHHQTVDPLDDDWNLNSEPVGFDDDRIRANVFAIPNDNRFDAREDWVDIGFAIQHETSKSAFGEDTFHGWSKQHNSHKDVLFTKAWKSFGTSEYRGRSVTFRYIIKLAKQYGKETFSNKIAKTKDLDELRAVCADVKLITLDELDREELAKIVQINSKRITGNRLSIKIARNMVRNAPVSTSAINGFNLNEDGVALAFTERYSERLKFCHATGHWYAWVGSHWRIEKTRLAFDWARETCRDLRGDAAEALSKAAAAEAVEKFARADRAFAVAADTWDTDPWLLGTPDGTIDLRTGEVREPRQEDFITKITAVAPGIGIGCPIWLKFLDEATASNAELIRFLQQWMGYNLTGDTREENLVFVYGKGGNGKGVWQGAFKGVLGGYASTASMETFAATGSGFARHSTEIASLHGARAVMTSETEEGHAWAESLIKALTGGDDISARFLYKDLFTFQPQFKLTVIGNNKPALHHVDDAMRRRINIIPFDYAPQTPDKTLKNRLKDEWPEILLWMVRGCLDWQENGLIKPEIVLSATKEYFSEQDTFQQWIDECCEIGDYSAPNSVLWESWDAFARSKREPVGNRNKTFPDSMRARGFNHVSKCGPENGRGFKGLRIKEVDFEGLNGAGL